MEMNPLELYTMQEAMGAPLRLQVGVVQNYRLQLHIKVFRYCYNENNDKNAYVCGVCVQACCEFMNGGGGGKA